MKLDYDEISPITGNKCVITEADEDTNITSYMCMESGFTTTDQMKIGSDTVKHYEEYITEFMRTSKHEDSDRGLIWYPSFLNMNGIGMLYPVGTSRDDMHWEVAKIVEITGDERKKYPVPGKTDEYYTARLDVENAQQFAGNEFESALDAYYSIAADVYTQMTSAQ
jgi:hypothetical protein